MSTFILSTSAMRRLVREKSLANSLSSDTRVPFRIWSKTHICNLEIGKQTFTSIAQNALGTYFCPDAPVRTNAERAACCGFEEL
jgi:hypothetical protein